MINVLTNLYSLSKTLRFQLIPVGKTEESFKTKNLLAQDEERAKNYKLVKGYMDDFHKAFIEKVLSKTELSGLDSYAALYFRQNKSEKENAEMEKAEADLRKQIAKKFTSDPTYKLLNKKEFVRDLLPSFLKSEGDEEAAKIVESFFMFTTYFTGFFQNRENMYSDEAKATSIANRCINENLPRFLDNAKSFEKIRAALSADDKRELDLTFDGLFGLPVEYFFRQDHFSFFLSQKDIDAYNSVLGGYTTSDGTKVQGVNEKVNLHNQKLKKDEKNQRLPVLKPLFKQILSERDSFSFISDSFENDQQVLNSVREFSENIAAPLPSRAVAAGVHKHFKIVEPLREFSALVRVRNVHSLFKLLAFPPQFLQSRQSTGVIPFSARKALAFEKCLQPKKPR